MNIRTSLLDKVSLQDGAFDLFTCSTLDRYVRMAKQISVSSGLHARLTSNELTLDAIMARANRLWQDARKIQQRGLEEVELAVILATISRYTADTVAKLVDQISLTDNPAVTWISALARRLRHENPTNEVLGEIKILAIAPHVVRIMTHHDPYDWSLSPRFSGTHYHFGKNQDFSKDTIPVEHEMQNA